MRCMASGNPSILAPAADDENPRSCSAGGIILPHALRIRAWHDSVLRAATANGEHTWLPG